jgi:hypothetical protein
MTHDPIVEEVRRLREAYAAQFDFDLDAIVRDLKTLEKRSGRQTVRLPPRKPSTHDSAA